MIPPPRLTSEVPSPPLCRRQRGPLPVPTPSARAAQHVPAPVVDGRAAPQPDLAHRALRVSGSCCCSLRRRRASASSGSRSRTRLSLLLAGPGVLGQRGLSPRAGVPRRRSRGGAARGPRRDDRRVLLFRRAHVDPQPSRVSTRSGGSSSASASASAGPASARRSLFLKREGERAQLVAPAPRASSASATVPSSRRHHHRHPARAAAAGRAAAAAAAAAGGGGSPRGHHTTGSRRHPPAAGSGGRPSGAEGPRGHPRGHPAPHTGAAFGIIVHRPGGRRGEDRDRGPLVPLLVVGVATATTAAANAAAVPERPPRRRRFACRLAGHASGDEAGHVVDVREGIIPVGRGAGEERRPPP